LTIQIDFEALNKACKNIIETILFCLPDAYKGTVYRIGRPPEMRATRITSGYIGREKKTISWGLPEKSDYNPPGKPWKAYRDEPGRPLEAMAWCVEKQKSWTAEDPKNDERSVSLQLQGQHEDFHHMEPVLVRKSDLYQQNGLDDNYPQTVGGETLWRASPYGVVAVIKIHFTPGTIKIGSPETQVIKRLSRNLGTELLSFQLRQQTAEAMHQLAKDKINSCNILADSLRNAIAKSGLIFSLIKQELGFLREQWEQVLLTRSEQKDMKRNAVAALNQILHEMSDVSENRTRIEDLIKVQNRFLGLSVPPGRGENWVRMQIEERWSALFEKSLPSSDVRQAVQQEIQRLKRSLHIGRDPKVLAAYDRMTEELKREWTELVYMDLDQLDFTWLTRLIRILDNPSFKLPFQEKSRKSLIYLQTLAQIMGQLEKSTNVVLRQVLNGHEGEVIPVAQSPVIVKSRTDSYEAAPQKSSHL
jgi:hypothetical protein